MAGLTFVSNVASFVPNPRPINSYAHIVSVAEVDEGIQVDWQQDVDVPSWGLYRTDLNSGGPRVLLAVLPANQHSYIDSKSAVNNRYVAGHAFQFDVEPYPPRQ